MPVGIGTCTPCDQITLIQTMSQFIIYVSFIYVTDAVIFVC